MKAKELIERLQAMKPEAEVVFPEGEFGDLESFEFVGYNPENPDQIVLDGSGYRWECNQPQPYRHVSESEKLMMEQISKSMFIMAKRFLEDKSYLLDDLPMISGPMRIHMPQINKIAQRNEGSSLGAKQQNCAKAGN